MSRFMVTLAAVALMAGAVAVPTGAQDPSPVEQAAQTGLPLLTEFTLRPGDQPYIFRYKASASGPHRMVAAWSTVVGIVMAVQGEGREPLTSQGNPASVSFQATKGVEYKVAIRAAEELPVTTVGQLYGGAKRASGAGDDSGPVIIAATPIPLPGPVTSGVTPVPLPGPVPQQVIQKLTAPLDLAAVLTAVKASPPLNSLLSSLPGGGTSTAHVRAPKAPEAVGDLDWQGGLRLRLWAECPGYFVNGQRYEAAALSALNVELEGLKVLKAEQAKGLVRLWPTPRGQVSLLLELPPEPGTYAIVVRLTDYQGTMRSTWATGDQRCVVLKCIRPWMDDANRVVELPLVPNTGPVGFATLLTIAPPNQQTYLDTWGPPLGMRKVTCALHLDLSPTTSKTGPFPPLLFAGFDIVRLN